MSVSAILALEDGSLFRGIALGDIRSQVTGEVVFNTAMTGYQEILTDPSYCGQMVTLTYPHIGNVGVNRDDHESDSVHANALIMHELPLQHSNWRAEEDLTTWLQRHGCIAIAGIDTRRLTRLLRKQGAMRACIATSEQGEDQIDTDTALTAARTLPGLEGMDLASDISTRKTYSWTQGSWGKDKLPTPDKRVWVYDFGVKRSILRLLVDHGCAVQVVPANTPVAEVLDERPDGIVLSNGPGDPDACKAAITVTRHCIEAGLPLLGICFGCQLLALACGARVSKMKFGHHGANHPVRDQRSGRVYITSQNHSFMITADTLPEALEVTHISLFDGSIQGIRHRQLPISGFQGHPEAAPGPADIQSLFHDFVVTMAQFSAK